MSVHPSSTEFSPYAIRRIILEQSKRANVGHIGSCLSVVDILFSLYKNILRIEKPGDPLRDRFILSKGHAALALYAVLHLKGWLSRSDLETFCGDNSWLGVHPEYALPGVDFSTGSLGLGLSMGTGAALAARLKKAAYRSFVLMSDAEINEGSVWEAAMFAAHHRLSNLIAIIDQNGQQAIGYTREVINLEPLRRRWEAFGWDVLEVNGHDVDQMNQVIASLKTNIDKPHLVVARTKFGKGVAFMENKIKWHYWPMSDEEFKTAMEDIGKESN